MPDSVVRVLLVEDDAADAALLRVGLRRAHDGVELRHVPRMADALEALATDAPDVVLLDLGLPDAHGLGGLRVVRSAAPGVPIVVLTGLDDAQLAEQALLDGAQDYLVKGEVPGDLLQRAIRYAVVRQRLTVEAEVARAQQLALKDEFLSHVSHELRSPLAVIHQFATILQDGLAGGLSPAQREYVDIVVQNAEQLGAMIEDLLEITRAQVGKLTCEPQCVGLAQAVDETVAAFGARASGRGIVLRAEVAPDLPTVLADPRRLHQVLGNLIDNALKFTQPGGTVIVGAAVQDDGAHAVRCWVRDTGCGMTADEAARCFERLYQVPGATTASRKGLGLGLYITRELVERQGGRITLESAPGLGSTFAFTLPTLDLGGLVSPLLAERPAPLPTIGVVEVLLAPACDVRPDHWDRLVREARDVVARCVLPDLDVLLPRVRGRGGRERFLVVAAAEEAGTHVLARRLREQLAATDPSVAGWVAHDVGVHTLPLAPWSDATGLAAAVAALVPHLETLMHRAPAHGR